MGGSGLISATWGFFNMRIAWISYHMLTYDHVIIYIRGYRDRLKKSRMPHISCIHNPMYFENMYVPI